MATPAAAGLRRTPDDISDEVAATRLRHTPDDISDEVAATPLSIAGQTADAALDAVGLQAGDTILIGGAAGGVGVFAVQLATLAGARVIADVALELGVALARTSTIAAEPESYRSTHSTGGVNVSPGRLRGSPTPSSPAGSPCRSPRPSPSSRSATLSPCRAAATSTAKSS